jgi:hypothetical protein
MPLIDNNYFTQREEKEPEYFTPDSKPYGMTYGQWTVKWWNWALSIPTEINPVYDDSGKFANVSQEDPNVFFLAGTFDGARVERRCTVPSGKAVLFPVMNYEVNPIEYPNLKTETQMIREVIMDQDDILNLEVTIDGKNVPFYRIRSDPPVFPLTISRDLIETKEVLKGVKTIASEAASDGYWIFLKHLSKGEHKIFFAGSCSSGARNVRATYNVTVI